jgi:hypothetical protein
MTLRPAYLLACLPIFFSAHLPAQSPPAVEGVASIRAVTPPNALRFAGLTASTDAFGYEIQSQGLDALFVLPDDGYAAHYSLPFSGFTNFFEETSDPAAPTKRFAYYYGPDAIYRMSGDSFDIIDRDTGQIESRTNKLGTPVKTAGLGDYLVTVSPHQLVGYSISADEIIYTIPGDETQANEAFVTIESDGDRVYALKRIRSGSFFSSTVEDTWLECYDLLSGARIFRRQVNLAFLEHHPNDRLNVVPFDVGFGVVAVGGVNDVALYNADDGTLIGKANVSYRQFNDLLQPVPYFAHANLGTVSYDYFTGALLVGDNRLYVQNENADGSTGDAPGVSVYDHQFQHLFDIRNQYLAQGITERNDFGGEMELIGGRLFIGSRLFYRQGTEADGYYKIDLQTPYIHIVEFTSPEGVFPQQADALYSEEAYRVSENEDLVVTLALSRGATVPVDLTVTPDFLTSLEAENPATAAVDFPTASQTVTFQPGETKKTLRFSITDDVEVEDPEQFQLVLTTSTPGVSVSDALREVTILSDDFDPDSDLIRMGRLDVGDREPGATIAEIAASNQLIAVGVPEAGKVLVYDAFTREFIGNVLEAGSFTGTFGEDVDVSGDTVVIGEPGASSGVGEITVARLDTGGASPTMNVLARITAPTVDGAVSEFGRRVRISGDTIAVGASVRTSISVEEERVFIFNETSPGTVSFDRTIGTPEPSNGDPLVSDQYFAWAFDLNSSHLVVTNPASEYEQSSVGGNTALLPVGGSVYIYALSNLAGAPLEIEQGAGFGTGIAAGTNDFVVVDSNNPLIVNQLGESDVLYRYSYGASLLNKDDRSDNAAPSQFLAELNYNDTLAMRSNRLSRDVLATFTVDDSTAVYPIGERFQRLGSGYVAALTTSVRGGFPRSGRVASTYVQSVNGGTGQSTGDELSAGINDDIFVNVDRADSAYPAVFQLPKEVAARVLPGSISEGDTLAASEGLVDFQLNQVSSEDVIIRFSTFSETAIVRADGDTEYDVFTKDGTVTIPAGATSATGSVFLNVDDEFEGDETFQVVIEAVENATVQDRVATYVILDNESESDLPLVSIGDTSFTESDIFTGIISNSQLLVNDAEIQLTLNEVHTEDVVIFYTVDSNNANFIANLRQTGFEQIENAGRFPPDYTRPRYGRDEDGDFTPDRPYPFFAYASVIPAGQTNATIEIPIANDAVFEPAEQLTVELIDVRNARLGADRTGPVTLLDDDPSDPAALFIGPPPSSTSQYGTDIAASADSLVSGDFLNELLVSDLDGTNPISIAPPRGTDAVVFGEMVAIGEDLVIGADLQNGFPATYFVYLFDTSGNLLGELTPSTAFNNFFGPGYGSSAALVSDQGATFAIIGTSASDQIFIFDTATRTEQRVIAEPQALTNFGAQIVAEGTDLLASSYGGGSFLYDWTDGSLLHHFDASGFAGNGFGSSIALSTNYVAIGGPGASTASAADQNGVVAVYDRSTYAARFVLAPPTATETNFGEELAIAGDLLAVLGDEGVHVYQLSDGSFVATIAVNSQSIAGTEDWLFIADSPNDEILRYNPLELLTVGKSPLEAFLIVNPTFESGGRELLAGTSLPPLVGFALGLENIDYSQIESRRLRLVEESGLLRIKLDTPGTLPPEIRLEVFETSDLSDPNSWGCIAVKKGSEPWLLLREGSVLPVENGTLEQLVIETGSESTPKSFYYLEAIDLTP